MSASEAAAGGGAAVRTRSACFRGLGFAAGVRGRGNLNMNSCQLRLGCVRLPNLTGVSLLFETLCDAVSVGPAL